MITFAIRTAIDPYYPWHAFAARPIYFVLRDGRKTGQMWIGSVEGFYDQASEYDLLIQAFGAARN